MVLHDVTLAYWEAHKIRQVHVYGAFDGTLNTWDGPGPEDIGTIDSLQVRGSIAGSVTATLIRNIASGAEVTAYVSGSPAPPLEGSAMVLSYELPGDSADWLHHQHLEHGSVRADVAEIEALIRGLDESLAQLIEQIERSETGVAEQLGATENELAKAESDLMAALIEAAAASLASMEAIEKGAQQSVADTAAAYARVSADLLVGQARSGTDAGATLSDVAKGMVESAIRGAITLSQIDQSLQASIADLTKAVLANLELLRFQSAAADQSRTEGIEFRDRTFDFVAKKTIDTLVDQAKQEQLDKLQAALNTISLIANFVPVLGQLVSAGIDLVNAAISVARGNYLDAGQYAFGAIPIVGDAAQVGRLGMTLQKGYAASNRLRQAHKLSSNFVTQTAVGMMPLGQEFATPYVISWLEEAPSNSFAAGTGVVTGIDEDGNYITTAIEDLRVGDVVLAGDEFNPNAPVKFALVTGTSHRTVYEQTTVTYVDADGNVEVIRTTGNHEFFVEGVGWKAAQHLAEGQSLILPDGSTATVTSVETEAIPDGIVVYNITVTDGATYFVDDGQGDVSAVWVHNANLSAYAKGWMRIFGKRNPREAVRELGNRSLGKMRDNLRHAKKFTLERHELLQHAWLKAHGYTNSNRLNHNPVIALSKKFHKKVSDAQFAQGLHDPAKLATMSVEAIVKANADILLELGVSKKLVSQLKINSTTFFESLKKAGKKL